MLKSSTVGASLDTVLVFGTLKHRDLQFIMDKTVLDSILHKMFNSIKTFQKYPIQFLSYKGSKGPNPQKIDSFIFGLSQIWLKNASRGFYEESDKNISKLGQILNKVKGFFLQWLIKSHPNFRTISLPQAKLSHGNKVSPDEDLKCTKTLYDRIFFAALQ